MMILILLKYCLYVTWLDRLSGGDNFLSMLVTMANYGTYEECPCVTDDRYDSHIL